MKKVFLGVMVLLVGGSLFYFAYYLPSEMIAESLVTPSVTPSLTPLVTPSNTQKADGVTPLPFPYESNTTDKLALREGPGEEYPRLRYLDLGDVVTVYELIPSKDGGTWARIDGGFVNAKYLSKSDKNPERKYRMNVPTITIDPDYAKGKLAEYREITVKQRRKEDVSFRRLWRAATSGKPILDLTEAFKSTGLNENFLPRLGFARADWSECHFSGYHHGFQDHRYLRRGSSHFIPIPSGTWDWTLVKGKESFTKVPFIPPSVRRVMKLKPENYYVLFEVTDWKLYPADPFLLTHITDNMYVVVGEWDLTPLEVSLLKGIR